MGAKKEQDAEDENFDHVKYMDLPRKIGEVCFYMEENKSVVFESEWLLQFILYISKLRISQPKSLRHFVRKNHQIFYLRFKNMGDTMIVTYGRNQI